MKNFVNFFCLNAFVVSVGIFLIGFGDTFYSVIGFLAALTSSYWASECLIERKRENFYGKSHISV